MEPFGADGVNQRGMHTVCEVISAGCRHSSGKLLAGAFRHFRGTTILMYQ